MILFKDNSKSLVLDFGVCPFFTRSDYHQIHVKTFHHPRGAVALVGVEQLVARWESEFHIIFVRKFCPLHEILHEIEPPRK